MKASIQRNSIRFKLSLVFVLIVSALQLIFWIFSASVLESVMVYGTELEIKSIVQDYMTAQKNSQILTTSEKESLIGELSYTWDRNITLVDIEKNLVLSTIPNRKPPTGPSPRGNIYTEIAYKYTDLPLGRVETTIRKDREGRDSMAIFIGNVGDNTILISEKPLNIIQDSSNLLTKYIIISGILTVSIGSMIILLLSKKLTQPIVDIEAQAKRLAALDFEQDNQVSQKDEIGSLGKAVNQISSELKGTIEALQIANSQLKDEIEQERKLERMRRRFVSSVSHELKTPISMIIGYADGLKFGVAKSTEQIHSYCNVIIEESEKMDQLIKDLLDMSAYQEGQLKISKEIFNFSEMVCRIGNLYSEQFSIKGLSFKMEVASNICINGDPLRIEQVLRNLLENALKYTIPEGTVSFVLSKNDEGAKVSLYNTCDPIPEEELSAIWMCFYRGEEGRNSSVEGFGVGLALVKEIVEKHHGTVTAINENSGVNFITTLPIQDV